MPESPSEPDATGSLQTRERELREAQKLARLGSWRWYADTDIVTGSEELYRLFGLDPAADEFPSFHAQDGTIYPHESWLQIEKAVAAAMQTGKGYEIEVSAISQDSPIWVTCRGETVRDASGLLTGLRGTVQDITERKRAEAKLRESESRYRNLFESMDEGFCVIEVLFDAAGHPVDYRFEEVNPAFERTSGLTAAQGRRMREMAPNLEQYWFDVYGEVASTGRAARFTHQAKALGRWFDVCASKLGGEGSRKVAVLFNDVTDRRAVDERLRASESHFRSLADDAPTMLWVTDADASCTYLSRQWYEYTGGAPESDLGLGWLEHIHPDDRDATGEVFLEASGRHAAFTLDYRLRRRDGQYRWAVDAGSPRFDDAGRFAGYVGTVTDVHDRRLAETQVREGESQFRQLVEQIQDYAIFMTDTAACATSWNEGVRRVLGYEEAEFIGLAVGPAIFTPEDQERNVPRAEFDEAARTGSANDDRWMQRRDGSRFWAVGVTTALRDAGGQLLGYMKIMRDQTHQRRMQDELRQLAADLSESNRRKTEFLATLGHELRNPLAPIRTGLELMKMTAGDAAALEQTRAMMERQTQQMVRLIDDLLDVSRITQGKLQLQTCRAALADVVRSAVEAAQPFVDEAGHELSVALPPQPVYLDCDPNRLAQVFSNLLNNSTKYTPEGGRIELSADARGGQVVVRVRDNGLGIPPQLQAGVFEMFNQIDRPLEKGYKGLGIGLTLVKRLVEMHGGRVEVRSEGEGRGSEFSVVLPLAKDSFAERASGESRPAAARKTELRILVVDDNTAAADILSTVARLLGNDVRTAYDGEQAVSAAEAFRPHVVLMDLGMPRMNGYEAARVIRGAEWGSGIVLVALTGWGLDEDRRRTGEVGFDHHLVKPAEPAALQQLFAQIEAGLNKPPA